MYISINPHKHGGVKGAPERGFLASISIALSDRLVQQLQ